MPLIIIIQKHSLKETLRMIRDSFEDCKDFSANNAQEEGDRRKRTRDRARTRDLHSFAELQPHELSVPAANASSPIALCTGRRCAAILRRLKTYVCLSLLGCAITTQTNQGLAMPPQYITSAGCLRATRHANIVYILAGCVPRCNNGPDWDLALANGVYHLCCLSMFCLILDTAIHCHPVCG